VTSDNCRENIRSELARAAEAIAAADLLFENGYVSDAVFRLYYYVLYHVRALLLSKGLELRSHEGALRLLGLYFIKEGLLDKRFGQIFSKLMKFREEADYNPVTMFTKEDYLAYRKEADTLSATFQEHLSKNHLP